MLLALYALQSWLSNARWRDAVFFGISAGVAVGSKFSHIPFLTLGFAVLAVAHGVLRCRGRRPLEQGAQAAMVGPQSSVRGHLIGFGVILFLCGRTVIHRVSGALTQYEHCAPL